MHYMLHRHIIRNPKSERKSKHNIRVRAWYESHSSWSMICKVNSDMYLLSTTISATTFTGKLVFLRCCRNQRYKEGLRPLIPASLKIIVHFASRTTLQCWLEVDLRLDQSLGLDLVEISHQVNPQFEVLLLFIPYNSMQEPLSWTKGIKRGTHIGQNARHVRITRSQTAF